jgi:hypothetical protein
MVERARFVVGDLTRTGLAQASTDPAAAAREARRILRPGRRLVLTTWQPKVPGDERLPSRLRIDWPRLLGSAGCTDIEIQTRPEWHDMFTRVYRVALDLGDPGGDTPSPTCRTKPGNTSLSRTSAIGWPSPQPLPASHRPRSVNPLARCRSSPRARREAWTLTGIVA